MRIEWGVLTAITSNFWECTALIALLVAAIAQTVFVISFSRRPWRRYRPGRAMMLKSSAVGFVLWLAFANTFLVYGLQQQISAVLTWVLAIAIVYQTIVLIQSPHEPLEPEEPS